MKIDWEHTQFAYVSGERITERKASRMNEYIQLVSRTRKLMTIRMGRTAQEMNEYLEQEERGHIWHPASSGNSASLLDRRITRMKQPMLSMARMFSYQDKMPHGVISRLRRGGFG